MGAQRQIIVADQDSIVNKQEDMDAHLKLVVERNSDMGSTSRLLWGCLRMYPRP